MRKISFFKGEMLAFIALTLILLGPVSAFVASSLTSDTFQLPHKFTLKSTAYLCYDDQCDYYNPIHEVLYFDATHQKIKMKRSGNLRMMAISHQDEARFYPDDGTDVCFRKMPPTPVKQLEVRNML